MLSSVAQRIYWLARYLERAENTTRLVSINASLMLDLPKHLRVGWGSVIGIVGAEALFFQRYKNSTEANVEKFLLADKDNPGSLYSCIRYARENGRTSREVLPYEAWEQLNELSLFIGDTIKTGINRANRHNFLDDVILRCQGITGLLAGTMSHGAAYQFLRLGQTLERADMTTRILDAGAATSAGNKDVPGASAYHDILWMSVLRSLSAFQMYRQQAFDRLGASDVARFLLCDDKFPRAVMNCLIVLTTCVEALPRSDDVLRLLGHLQRIVKEADPDAFKGEALHDFIDELQIEMMRISDQVSETWFIEPAADEMPNA
ncbi:MAG: alpha-E domain-containing protein [Pseudomonadota bacterium]